VCAPATTSEEYGLIIHYFYYVKLEGVHAPSFSQIIRVMIGVFAQVPRSVQSPHHLNVFFVLVDRSMSSRQEIWLPNLPDLASTDASRCVGTIRDHIVSGAQPQKEQQVPVEQIATIQALAQGDDHLDINAPEHVSALMTDDAEKKGKHEITFGNTGSNGLEMRVEEGNDLDPKYHAPVPPQSNRDPPSTVPLHLVPLVPQTNPFPWKKRQPSIDPLLQHKNKNDVDPIDPHATGETPSTFQTRIAGSSGISRTLTYAMNQMKSTRPAGSLNLPVRDGKLESLFTLKGAEAGHQEEVVTTREALKLEETTLPFSRGVHSLGSGGAHADAIAQLTDGETGRKESQVKPHNLEAQSEVPGLKAGRQEEGEQVEFLAVQNPGKVTFADMRPRGAGECEKATKADAWCSARNQDDEGPNGDQRDVFEEFAAREIESSIVAAKSLISAQGRMYTKLKDREMEIRRARRDNQLLEETFEAIEKDLCNRLETIRQGLETIRQRKAFIDREEDDLRQILGVEEDQADSLLEASSLYSVSSYK
jgi:hypothetical protein